MNIGTGIVIIVVAFALAIAAVKWGAPALEKWRGNIEQHHAALRA